MSEMTLFETSWVEGLGNEVLIGGGVFAVTLGLTVLAVRLLSIRTAYVCVHVWLYCSVSTRTNFVP